MNIFIYSYIIDIDMPLKKPLKKGGVKSSSKKPLKKEGVKSSSKMPLKKGGVKSSSKKLLKKGGGTDDPPQSALSVIDGLQKAPGARVFALAKRMQNAPQSALSVMSRLKPLENPQSAKTVKGPSLKLQSLIEKLSEPQYKKILQES